MGVGEREGVFFINMDLPYQVLISIGFVCMALANANGLMAGNKVILLMYNVMFGACFSGKGVTLSQMFIDDK